MPSKMRKGKEPKKIWLVRNYSILEIFNISHPPQDIYYKIFSQPDEILQNFLY